MKLTVGILLSLVLGTMFLGLFGMSSSMDMNGHMSDCPFMSHNEVVCPMDFADHIGAWKSVFLAIAPTVLVLTGLAGVLLFVRRAPHLVLLRSVDIPIRIRYVTERFYLSIQRPLQELFSNGILHPKLF